MLICGLLGLFWMVDFVSKHNILKTPLCLILSFEGIKAKNHLGGHKNIVHMQR